MQGVPLAFDPERYRSRLQNRPDPLTIFQEVSKGQKECLYKISLSLFDPATATMLQQAEQPASIYPKNLPK